MHILHNTQDCPDELKGVALAIGNFDGVHLGHQAVIRASLAEAKRSGAPSAVMTFEPHPRAFFQPGKPMFRLTPPELKLKLFEALGLDMTVALPFDAALAARPAESFVSEILVRGLGVSHVITGSDFHFGKGRDGNPDVMRTLGEAHGFGATIVTPQSGEGGVYSSTQIRNFLREGNPRGAADSLGYWWRVNGEVIGGDKRGHGLGYPTANIAVPEGFELKHGIYAVRVRAGGVRYHAAAYLGTRPSFDDGESVLETFLFDFEGDLYGQVIELEIIEFLRGDERFDSPEALIGQIKADCERAEQCLTRLDENDPFGNGLLGGGPDGC